MRAPLPQASLSGYRTSHPARGINYAGPCGDNGFLEDYTTQVRGEPIGVIVTVSRDVRGPDAGDRGQPPAAQLGAVLLPLDGGEVRRRAFRRLGRTAVLAKALEGGGQLPA